jgi:hypothetical protein
VREGEIAGLAGGIRELDISGNVLPDWEAVQHFNTELPELETLDLR